MAGVAAALHPHSGLPEGAAAVYADALAKCAASNLWAHMHESCLLLGQASGALRTSTRPFESTNRVRASV
jgi:hypothetical protein